MRFGQTFVNATSRWWGPKTFSSEKGHFVRAFTFILGGLVFGSGCGLEVEAPADERSSAEQALSRVVTYSVVATVTATEQHVASEVHRLAAEHGGAVRVLSSARFEVRFLAAGPSTSAFRHGLTNNGESTDFKHGLTNNGPPDARLTAFRVALSPLGGRVESR